MQRPIMITVLLWVVCAQLVMSRSVSVTDFGAVGDNATDNTAAFRAAAAAAGAGGGGELLVPAGDFKTAPFNLTSNVRLTVMGTVWGWENCSAFPLVAPLPSYASTTPSTRYHPLVWAVNASNVSIAGSGTINGGGPYWLENSCMVLTGHA